jgi:hypothetical protein
VGAPTTEKVIMCVSCATIVYGIIASSAIVIPVVKCKLSRKKKKAKK